MSASDVRGMPIDVEDVRAATARLEGLVHRTPLLRSRALDAVVGAEVVLKGEHLQRGGAFKARGAGNAVGALRPSGVCAASSGNHAQALALVAAEAGIPAVILMPRDAPAFKLAAVERYGAEIVPYDRFADDREALTEELARLRGLTLVHSHDEPLVMAGQGTVGLELLEQAGELDLVLVPCGGGGLLSGVATAVRALSPATRIVGVEPEASDDVARSLRSGRRERVEVRPSIADGQLLATPGLRPWQVISQVVDDVVVVSDEEIVAALRFLFQEAQAVVEPSGASALAALLSGRVAVRGPVGVVLSGGNVAPDRLAKLLRVGVRR